MGRLQYLDLQLMKKDNAAKAAIDEPFWKTIEVDNCKYYNSFFSYVT